MTFLDRYEATEQIGGLVPGQTAWSTHRGRDVVTSQEVAIRTAQGADPGWLPGHLPTEMTPAEWAEALLAREARALSRLDHPRIVKLLASGAGVNVTESARGSALRDEARRGPDGHPGLFFPEVAALIVRQAADALDHAHSRGVTRLRAHAGARLGDGGVKLVDFRLAGIVDDEPSAPRLDALRPRAQFGAGGASHPTHVVWSEPGDALTDVYCLGSMLFTLLTSCGPTVSVEMHWNPHHLDPAGLITDGFRRLTLRAASTDRSRRPPTAAAMRAELDALLAEVGIADPDAELAAFIADRTAYRRAFPARALAALESDPAALARRGDKALRAGVAGRAVRAVRLACGRLGRITRRGDSLPVHDTSTMQAKEAAHMTTKTAAKKTSKKTTAAKRPATKKAAPATKTVPVAKTPPAAKTAPAAAVKPAAKKEPRVSMWGTARELIKAGKTNADVLAVLRERFALPEEHNFYPVWYRAYAVKHGVVTREFAKAHAGPRLARKPV